MLAGLTYLDADTWQYENAGTADTLTTGGTTLNNLPLSQSRTGSAFYQTTYQKCFDLPATSEVWIKFDVYFNGSNRWRAYNGGTNGTTGITAQTNGYCSLVQNSAVIQNTAKICKTNTLQTVLLHMQAGSSDGVIEAWGDGALIYSYSGDVNHGSDFADLYLQSDGAGTFFSNVIISNAQIGLNQNIVNYSCELKPEIYISYIPTGKIGLKPQIYAAYIPTPEKSHADLLRKITSVESSRADSLRQVGQGENIPADILRRVTAANETAADTMRKLFADEQIMGDTFRRAVHAAKIHADIYREVKVSERTIGDTSRRMGLINIRGDLWRQVNVTTVSTADTCRKIGIAEEFPADIYLRTARDEIAKADTFRKAEAATSAIADACRQIGVREKFSAATVRVIGYTETTAADTFLQITASEKIIADLLRGIRDVAHADTKRKLVRREKTVAQTVIRIPHILTYTVQESSGGAESSDYSSEDSGNEASGISEYSLLCSAAFEEYGITAIHLSLNEKTLSDSVRIELARPLEIGDTIILKLLDYEFEFRIEETSQTELIQSATGTFSPTATFYEWFNFSKLKESDEPPKAATIMDSLLDQVGLEEAFAFNNFTPTNFSCDSPMTYSDVLSLIFGWTSQVPNHLINVFIRGKYLYVVERGQEKGKANEPPPPEDDPKANERIDITKLPRSRPTINRKIYRTMCNNPNASSDDDASSDDYKKTPFSGTVQYVTEQIVMLFTYANGLLVKEHYTTLTETENARKSKYTVSTTYTYISDTGETDAEISYYVGSKSSRAVTREYVGDVTSNVTDTQSMTFYHYKYFGSEIYLFLEEQHTVVYEYMVDNIPGIHTLHNDEITEETERETYHAPVGNGFYAQLVYENGILQGGNLSQGKPGNSVSQYIIDKVQESFHTATTDTPDGATPIINPELPIEGRDQRRLLTDALEALDGKIQETVTVDVIASIYNGIPSIDTIIDFNKRVILDGNEYFLASNNITFTPRKFIQKLQLIRWY